MIPKHVRKITKRIIACLLIAAMVASNGYGYGIFNWQVEAQAASTEVLSGAERNVIFASTRTDFRDESIYFTIVTRYYNGDESNDVQCWDGTDVNLNDPAWRGDFKGLIEKLDYIKALGFTAIWITPVVKNCSGYDYHGYHALNFKEVDERYESDDCTYQDLIDACHAKGMKIIQDVVFNHTGNFGEENLLPIFTKEGDLSSVDCLKQVPGSGLPADYDSLIPDDQYNARLALMKNTDGQNHDVNNIYHHYGHFNWDNHTCQLGQIAGDCVDLNTENPIVYNYLVDAYTQYINMGVDGFRVDTVRHISRLTFNKVFNDAFIEAGKKNGKDFFMFGEVCTRSNNGTPWYRDGLPAMSAPFYTWKDSKDYAWSDTDWEINYESAIQNALDNESNVSEQPTSQNALLDGNDYHTPDYSMFSGLNVIDFPMHWAFKSAESAFNVAKNGDTAYNDATWNVTYVDSHDYAPDQAPESQRFAQDQDVWAENLALMFTFRGIPCIYYGTETEFQKGATIDKGPLLALAESGRAYYGDNIEGTITAVDFGEYGNVSGPIADTLKHPLSQHIQRLNRLRQAIPALRKGQYSTEGVSGKLAFKRRYTDNTTDSFVCVSISGDATFSDIPNGTYVDAVTGDVQEVTDGTLNIKVSGKGNLKAYVLDTDENPAPGRVITNGLYLTDGGAIQDIEPLEDIEIIEPTGITVSDTEVSLLEEETAKVTATVAPDDATNPMVTWTSSNPEIATVRGGTITGVAPGEATITAATTNGLTAEVKVTVSVNPNIIKPTGITLSETSVKLTEKDTVTITANVMPSNATNQKVTWESADTKIATVNAAGTITAVSEGTTTITASTFNGYEATVTVEVEPREIPTIENGIYFEKPADWKTPVCAYFFADDAPVGEKWPGIPMEDLGEGIWGLPYQSDNENLKVIFNEGEGGRQTAGSGFDYHNNGYYDSTGFLREVVNETGKGKVTIQCVDTDGKVLSSKIMRGDIGSDYTTTAPDISGYTVKTAPANATGTYTEEDIIVTYVYEKNVIATGKVIIKYVDEAGNTIKASATQTGNVGESYSTTAATITGYTVKTTPANAKGTYTEADITVTYVYKKNETPTPEKTGTVTVKYVDEDGVEIEAAQTLSGKVGATYTTEAATIAGYTLQTTPANATGTYTEEDITVTYIYKGNSTPPTPVKTGKVIVKYVDEAGTEIKASATQTGKVGVAYTTTAAVIEGYTVKTAPANANGTYTEADITVTYIYKKNEAPTPQTAYTVYLELPEGWETPVKCSVYAGSGSDSVLELEMTKDPTTGYYVCEIPDTITNPKVIFRSGNKTCPADGTRLDLTTEGSWVYKDGQWGNYTGPLPPVTKKGKVTICYIDESGAEIRTSETKTGNVGETYTTTAPDITGYTVATPANATGTYTEEEITVIYVYKKNSTPTPVATGTVTVKYVDESGKAVAAQKTLKGNVGAAYTTTAATVAGYTLKTAPANAKGTYTKANITVTYVYKKNSTTSTTVKVDKTFRKMLARVIKTTKTSNKLKWSKVKGADGYIVYGAAANKKVKKLKDQKTTTYTHKKLKKGTYYKYEVKAYKVINGKKVVIATSKTAYSTTDGGKYGNAKKIKVNKTSIKLKKGGKFTIKASAVKANRKIKTYRKLTYESSNTKVATVSKKGVIKAKKKGTCTIYVYTQNGVYKKIKVTVK